MRIPRETATTLINVLIDGLTSVRDNFGPDVSLHHISLVSEIANGVESLLPRRESCEAVEATASPLDIHSLARSDYMRFAVHMLSPDAHVEINGVLHAVRDRRQWPEDLTTATYKGELLSNLIKGAEFGAMPTTTPLEEAIAEAPKVMPRSPIAPAETPTQVPVAAPPIDTTQVGAEVDERGIPHDPRIHCKPPTFLKDGTWKYKRNIDRVSVVPQVEAELLALMGNVPAAPAAPVVAPILPTAPPLPTAAPLDYGTLIHHVTGKVSEGAMTQDTLESIFNLNGITISTLHARPDLFETIKAQVDAQCP